MAMLGYEGFGERPIEAFDLSIHLGTSRVRMKVNNAFLFAEQYEMILKF